MKKRSKGSHCYYSKGCLFNYVYRVVFVVFIASTISSYLHAATIQTSFEGQHDRSEFRPSVGDGNSEFYAIGAGTVVSTSNGSQSYEEAYEVLGENGKIQFHQSATDPADNQDYNAAAISYGYTRGGGIQQCSLGYKRPSEII